MLAAAPRSPNPLFRTHSASSVSSVDTQSSFDDVAVDDAPRRTRKRFSSTQLMMLEHLYHQTSHPTREQREMLAKEAAIELRSVTVWFQNKRQTERKVAMHTSQPVSGDDAHHHHHQRARRISHPSSSSPALSAASTASSSTRTIRSHLHLTQLSAQPSRRPSLDTVAARMERPQPRTPPRIRTLSSPTSSPLRLYDHMPSSPSSPLSPAATDRDRDQELLDFGLRRCRSKPTLEWACAAARVSGYREQDEELEEMVLDAGGDTEDEEDMDSRTLVTPHNSLGADARAWGMKTPKPLNAGGAASQEDMEAALALCGLGGATIRARR